MKTVRRILFVCMGNICRSPSAEGIFKELAFNYPELQSLEIDSCGTIGHHVGETADSRSIEAAKNRGYDLSNIRSRKIDNNDLEHFDLILAMDLDNLNKIHQLDLDNMHRDKIRLFLKYSSQDNITCIPDPYYGGHSGFNDVIDLIEDASRGLIKKLLK